MLLIVSSIGASYIAATALLLSTSTIVCPPVGETALLVDRRFMQYTRTAYSRLLFVILAVLDEYYTIVPVLIS